MNTKDHSRGLYLAKHMELVTRFSRTSTASVTETPTPY